MAALAVGLAFFRDRMRLIVRAVACTVLLVAVGALFSLQISGSAVPRGGHFQYPSCSPTWRASEVRRGG